VDESEEDVSILGLDVSIMPLGLVLIEQRARHHLQHRGHAFHLPLQLLHDGEGREFDGLSL